MIDSLFDLIAALFIASLPILLAIIRSRRRRGAREARTSSAGDSAAGGRDSVSKSSRPQSGTRRLGQMFFRGFKKSPGAEAANENEREEQTQPEARREQPRQAPRRVEAPGLDRLGAAEKRERQGGKNRLTETANRYPPLQRAIVLKEILGGPKGLE